MQFETEDLNDKVIFTDHEITKYFIWEAYNGLKTMYGNYLVNKNMGRDKTITRLGLKKYITEFLIQISPFLKDPKLLKKISPENLKKIEQIYDKCLYQQEKDLTEQENTFVRIFSETFLKETGLKDISRIKKDPGGAMFG